MTPIEPDEILDPDSERVRSLGGARVQTISLAAAPTRLELQGQAASAPPVFAASFPPTGARVSRWRLPLASTALNVAGQGLLGASIATGTVDPAIGAGAAAAWTICGLVLIAAQCVSILGAERPEQSQDRSGVTP